jgi:hypothetical protein
MNKTWSVLIVSLLSIVAGPLNAQRAYTKTTVCRLLSLGAANLPKNVEIKANVMADHMHGALLTDPKCPGGGIFLDVSPSHADQSVTEFDHVLWSDGPPGFGDRTVSGVFFGELRIGGKLPLTPGHKKISIALLRVESLSDSHSREEH